MSLEIVQALGLVTIQDLGRPGHMHEGLAPGGALVPALLVAANRAAGNPDHSPALEVFGKLVVRALDPIETSAGSVTAGQTIAIQSEPRRVAYLAIRGGIDAPLVLGGRATQLSAGLGARLLAGARVNRAVSSPSAPPAPPDAAATVAADGPIRVIPGPDLDAFAPDALEDLCSSRYRVLPTSDRVGTRLEGPRLARLEHRERSRPMVRGAIEVPRDAAPIVLGPEHPTTGGYPIIGVVARDDLDRFFAVRVGGTMKFEVGHGATSRS